MTPRPTTFGELIRRLSPEVPNACSCPPIVASAVELDPPPGARQRAFWVLLHSPTDGSVRLFHAKPVRAKHLSIRIQAEGGEVVQALVTVAHSSSRGGLYETTADFQRV
ncbi:MAG TPA: hypothetical protein VG125_29075, partial [Pirellulales bacterium]|nr:hypothetical protein [Pirellulales bacterium]